MSCPVYSTELLREGNQTIQRPHRRGEPQHRLTMQGWTSGLEASSKTIKTNLLSLQMRNPLGTSVFLGQSTADSGKTRSPACPRRSLLFSHHGHVGTTRPDLPGMRSWNQCRTNNHPYIPRQWASEARAASLGKTKGGRLELCKDPAWEELWVCP